MRSVLVPPIAAHNSTVILLHGLGDSGMGWRGAAEMLAPALPQTKWILPNAPNIKITLNYGACMPGWYDIFSLDPSAKEDEHGIFNSVSLISSIIAEEIKSGISPEKIILAGFSQGAALSALYAISTSVKLGGIVLLSGYLPLSSKFKEIVRDTNIKTPILMCHGTQDQVVDYSWGKASCKKLADHGFNVDFRSYQNMGHTASQEELTDILKFIKDSI